MTNSTLHFAILKYKINRYIKINNNIFKKFDKTNSGKLPTKDFQAALAEYGFHPKIPDF